MLLTFFVRKKVLCLHRSHLKELDETQLTDIQALKSAKQDDLG
jgi:hypothetical protein